MTERGIEESLGRRSVTAMLWGTGGAVVRIGLQIVSQIVLARLLGPELFGLFAVALVVVLLTGLFADVGLAYGLIQKPTVSEADIRFVVTWQALLGLVVSLLLLLAAPAIAALYGDPRVAAVVTLLAPACLINSAAATSGALLRREMDFKTLNIAAVASYAIGYFVVAIPMALAGAGVAALVIAYLVQSVVLVAVQYARCQHALRPLLWHEGAPGMLSFGLTVLATNLVNWAMAGIDRVIAGAALGVPAAGLYATACNLIGTPLLTALSLLQSIFYSASAKVQDDKAQLGRGLVTLFGTVLLFIAPVFAGVASAAETIFVALYGPRWSGGGTVLAPLALAMPAQLLMGLATPVLWASGATRRELEIQIPIAAAWIAVLWLVAQWGSLAVLSWAVCLLFYVRAGVIVRATLAAVDLAPGRLLEASYPGLVVTCLVAIAGLASDRGLADLAGPGLTLLALDIAACAIVFLIAIRLVRRRVGDEVVRLLSQLAQRLPGDAGERALRLMLGRRDRPAPHA